MALFDPFPGRELLERHEVRALLSLKNEKDFRKFLVDEPRFPREVVAGRTANGKPRRRFRKSEVMAYMDFLPRYLEPDESEIGENPERQSQSKPEKPREK